MKKKIEDDEKVTEENVEKYMVKALKKYREIGQDTDFWFWRLSLPLFRKKIEKDKISEVREWLNVGYKWYRNIDDKKRILLYFDKTFGKVKP